MRILINVLFLFMHEKTLETLWKLQPFQFIWWLKVVVEIITSKTKWIQFHRHSKFRIFCYDIKNIYQTTNYSCLLNFTTIKAHKKQQCFSHLIVCLEGVIHSAICHLTTDKQNTQTKLKHLWFHYLCFCWPIGSWIYFCFMLLRPIKNINIFFPH